MFKNKVIMFNGILYNFPEIHKRQLDADRASNSIGFFFYHTLALVESIPLFGLLAVLIDRVIQYVNYLFNSKESQPAESDRKYGSVHVLNVAPPQNDNHLPEMERKHASVHAEASREKPKSIIHALFPYKKEDELTSENWFDVLSSLETLLIDKASWKNHEFISLFVNLLNLPDGPSLLKQMKIKTNHRFLIILGDVLSQHPDLRQHLPQLYSENELNSLLLPHWGFSERQALYSVLEFYPNLSHPDYVLSNKLLIANKLRELLGKHFSLLIGWYFYAFNLSFLNRLPIPIQIELLEKLMKDEDATSLDILIWWATDSVQDIYSLRRDSISAEEVFSRQLATEPDLSPVCFNIYEEIYERLSNLDKIQLLEETLVSHSASHMLNVSHSQIIKGLVKAMLENKPLAYIVVSNYFGFDPYFFQRQSPILNQFFQGLTDKDWETVGVMHFDFSKYVFTHLPKLAKKIYPHFKMAKYLNTLFTKILYPTVSVNDSNVAAVQNFVQALPKEKVQEYAPILDPIKALRNCEKGKAVFVQNFYQLQMREFFKELIDTLVQNEEFELLNVLFFSCSNPKGLIKKSQIPFLVNGYLKHRKKEAKKIAQERSNDNNLSEEDPEVIKTMEELAKRDNKRFPALMQIISML